MKKIFVLFVRNIETAEFVITQFVTQNRSTRVQAIFYLPDDCTTFIVPKEWAGDACEISCEILVNGESLGVKELLMNFLVGRDRRRDISAYTAMVKLEITEQDNCVLILK